MTATTTTVETEPGPVVVPAYLALTTAAERFRQTEDALRKAFTPTAILAAEIGREASRMATATEQISREVAASRKALEQVSRWAAEYRAEHAERSAQVARLRRDARRISRGNARISVTLTRLLTYLRDHGETWTADLVTLALQGDPDALRYWHTAEDHGAPEDITAAVLSLLQDLAALRADADALAAEVAALVASVTLTDLPETAEPIPPPRITLAGSLDPNAPPVASPSATAGNVLTANGSPMR